MKQEILTIKENTVLARDVYRMILAGEIPEIKPGQFLNIALEGRFLRRPISICDWDEETITIIYKVVGEGTADMSAMEPGDTLDVLVPLGNGFDPQKAGQRPLLIGGGVGVPPMYGLAKRIAAKGIKPEVILGFNGAEDAFYRNEFEEAGASVRIATVDGSLGTKGMVADLIEDGYTAVFACGPIPMLRAIDEVMNSDILGFFSLEERMGCGFGVCMGCSHKTKDGYKRICKEGPVLRREEIVW